MSKFPVFFALTALFFTQARAAESDAERIGVVTGTPGLVAFWMFGEEAGKARVSAGTKEKHALAEVNGPIARVVGGPYSGFAADLNGRQYFHIPYAATGDLNIGGKDAQVSMFAVVRIVNLRQSRTIAGMWSEGKGANDDTGTRQYAMLMNMPTYGGPNKLVPHISSEGGVTRRAVARISPWARYAVGSMLGEASIGRFGGLAVFNRALTDAEMKVLHDSARIESLPQ